MPINIQAQCQFYIAACFKRRTLRDFKYSYVALRLFYKEDYSKFRSMAIYDFLLGCSKSNPKKTDQAWPRKNVISPFSVQRAKNRTLLDGGAFRWAPLTPGTGDIKQLLLWSKGGSISSCSGQPLSFSNWKLHDLIALKIFIQVWFPSKSATLLHHFWQI